MNERSEARLAYLTASLSRGGSLRLAEAAVLCGVSEMTVRRDLANAESGLVLVGGLLMRADDPRHASAYDLAVQHDRHAESKQRLCDRALAMLEEGDTLFIDCGTTLMPLATQLPTELSLTVVTYALNVAEAVSQRSGVRLWLLGGLYQASSCSFEGDEMVDTLARLGINKAFLSAAGVHPQRGLSCFHFHEVAPKQAAIASAQRRILVVDSSKHGLVRPARFADLGDIDEVISEDADALVRTGATS
ncbi:DeoR/GlpR family DNA-binding transcription regulator [Halomonas sp. 18H]|uniref:DeoR/GlpR family DNA-binding transcription regulator n=1 Tax=Halomonas almeriensis TaxID=308163 RepID=UPI0022313FA5|nr:MULTISPECIES: DeoR/GlpR family DNA-binding transcription regulator [Halomonas]MCW4149241.1 DeoR/GlpR family DNA-binding transcription regulator [Halomonas sp. 18H]MDN3552207.1 DeoR/GlpR family DNA-binding transcription regulator [Halomonas almeriensis]